MTRPLPLAVLILASLAVAARAQAPDLVPRRVLVAQTGPAVAPGAPQLATVADALFAAVAARTPLVRVDDAGQAQARLEVAVAPQGGGFRLAASLYEGERTAASRETVVTSGAEGFAGYTSFLRETAELFAPLLPMMEPQVVLGDASREARYRDVAAETDFAKQLAAAWEITFWAGGLSELYHEPLAARSGQLDVREMPLLPLWLDAAWYYSRNGGLVASFFFDYGDFTGLATIYSGDIRLDKARSTNLFLLPGIGITYRTLAPLSAQFATVFYLGPMHVAAEDALRGIAAAGEETWSYYFMMSLSSALSWNITSRLSVKTRVAVNLDMMSTFLSGVSNRETYAPIMLQFFTLGAAWRP